jgi:hypothetical protein
MPVLKLHFPSEMVDHENFEDVLTFTNKNIQGDGDTFKSRTSWMRNVLRTYAILSNNNRRRWESNKTMVIEGKSKKMPDLKIWKGSTSGDLEDGFDGELIGLNIGDLQYKYLQRAVEWENTFQTEINRSDRVFANVAELSQNIILNQLLTVWSQVDEEKMRLEEDNLDEVVEEDNL